MFWAAWTPNVNLPCERQGRRAGIGRRADDAVGPIDHHAEYEHGKGKEMVAKLQKDVKILREWLA